MRVVFFFLGCVLILSSCYSNKSLLGDIKDFDKKMGVSEYTTVQKNDRLDYINFGSEFQLGSVGSISPGVKFQIGTLEKGIISGNANYVFSMIPSTDNNYGVDSKVPALNLRTTYSYPIWTIKKTGVTRIYLYENREIVGHTIDNDSPFYRFISLEGGLDYSSLTSQTDLWAENKINENPAFRFPKGRPEGNANINQASITGYIGIRLSQFINTFISGKGEGKNLKGVKKELLDFRFGLKPLLFSLAPDVNYSYLTFQNGSVVSSHQEYVNPRDFLQKSNVGFSIGISYTGFWDRVMNWSVNYYAEVGINPGYAERYVSGGFARIGIKLGFIPRL